MEKMSKADDADPVFPDDWYYSEDIWPDGALRRAGVRCFETPDYKAFPPNVLTNHALFRRLLLSMRDFSQARSAMTFIKESVDWDERYPRAELRRFQAYETSLIVSYSRPFSESRGDLPRLSFRSLGIKLSKFTKSVHDNVIRKRDQVFAHSDWDAIEHLPPFILRGRTTGTKCEFTVMYPPRFIEGFMLDKVQLSRLDILLACTSHAVHMLAQAMHSNFLHDYEVHDLQFLENNSSGTQEA